MRLNLLLIIMVISTSYVYSQEVRYDTTYQVTYENGIKDSVIVIYKRVLVNEKVYIVDSTENRRWAIDIYLTPLLTTTLKSSSSYSSSEITNHNEASRNIGQSIGSNLYYKGKKLDFRFGLSFSKHNLKLKSERNLYSQLTTKYMEDDTLDTYWSIDDQNDTSYFYIIDQIEKTKTETKTEVQNKSATLNLFYLELTLQAGYKKQLGNWNFYIFLGPSSSFLINSNGNVFNEKGEKITSKKEYFVSPIFNLQTNLQTCYSFSKRAQLFVEPYFQKYLFPLNNKPSYMYTKDMMGIKAGLKFFL